MKFIISNNSKRLYTIFCFASGNVSTQGESIYNEQGIPRSAKGECTRREFYREWFGVCTCDDHCSWDLCRTFDPPIDCLFGTNSRWEWDPPRNAWVAKIFEGNYVVYGLAVEILNII